MIDRLQELAHAGLFGNIWPPERIHLASRTCKWLHSEIGTLAEDVVLKVQDFAPLPSHDIVRSLELFKHNRISVVARTKSSHVQPQANGLLRGLSCAVDTCGISHLVAVDLGRSGLQGEEVLKLLANVLTHASNLIRLKLDENCIEGPGARILEPALKCCSRVQHLDFSRNALFHEGVVAMIGVLHAEAPLTHLDISGNACGPDAIGVLAEALPRDAALTHLAVGRNRIGDEGAEHLTAALRKCTRLRCLLLPASDFGPRGGLALQRAIGRCSALTQLELEGAPVGSGVAGWAAALARLTCLTELALRKCGLADDNAAPLGTALQNLQGLSLQGNGVQGRGLEELAAGTRRLRRLDLSLNGIGQSAVGGANVGGLLAGLQDGWAGLEELTLRENRVNDAGAMALAGTLGVMGVLRRLDLARNNLSAFGATRLAQAAGHPRCSSLTSVNLALNSDVAFGARHQLQGFADKVDMGLRR